MLRAQPPEATPGVFFPHQVNNSRDAIVANVRTNSARGLRELSQQPWSDLPLMIVAGGPSVHDHLEIIQALKGECHILAVNGAYKFLRSKGIEPNYFVMIDSREGNLVHVDSPGEGTLHCLASQVHPRVFDALQDHDVALFHLGTEATIEALGSPDGQDYLTAPIGMASVHAIYLGAGLGYRSQLLFGYDFSQKEQQQYAYEQLMNLSDDVIEIPLGGKVFRTTISLARTADQFVRAVSPVILGCKLNIQMFSDGLLPEMLRVASLKANVESEQAKYERIWGLADYRKVSPGFDGVIEAIAQLSPERGASIADLGCGTGRAVRWLRDRSYDAIGVDIATNALEEDVPFVHCALWEASKLPRADYAICTDVLEHIPTERVRDTLRAIHGAVGRACYLNIDTIPDSFGVLIGERLHMTVMSHEAWASLLREFWPDVTAIEAGERQAVFVCRK